MTVHWIDDAWGTSHSIDLSRSHCPRLVLHGVVRVHPTAWVRA